MFGRSNVVENQVVAKHMRSFFKWLPRRKRRTPATVAESYARHMFDKRKRELVDEKRLSRSSFHIGLGVDSTGFADLTKRSTLVSDTLLLSHDEKTAFQTLKRPLREMMEPTSLNHSEGIPSAYRLHSEYLGVKCPDLDSLGEWILDTEPLLKAGLAWYLPRYGVFRAVREPINPYHGGLREESAANGTATPSILDFLIQNGRAVSQAGATPEKCDVIRPVLEIDLPFLDGVSLRDFGEITVNEFESYQGFRAFLQDSFLALDSAVHATASERDMIRIGHQIQSEIRGVQARMSNIRRRRAVAVTGAGIGAVGATLVAVYGPAFQTALSILGVAGAGGIWGMIQSGMNDNSRTERSSQWYYVWALAQKGRRL